MSKSLREPRGFTHCDWKWRVRIARWLGQDVGVTRRLRGHRAHAIATLVFLLAAFACGCGTQSSAPRTAAPAPAARSDVGFRTHALLAEHYAKHGAEFGSPGIDAYLRQAQALRDAPAGGDVLEAVRDDRVVTRFDRASGAFIAFDASGVIRTFFRPRDGERYFHRQAARRDDRRTRGSER